VNLRDGSSDQARSWAREFARPLPVLAAIVLALNDHVLKGARVFPGWLTGKLSDVAGLFFFPVLLFALSCALLGTPRRRTPRAAFLACVTGLVFVAVKVLPAANALARRALGDIALDPSDLLALPLVVVSVLYLQRAPGEAARGGELARRAAVLLAALASLATSAPRMARNYPSWEVRGAFHQTVGCVELSAEVVKSGKSGLGALVRRDVDNGCDVRIEAARVRVVGAGAFEASSPPAFDEHRTLYLSFAFDNEAHWNEGAREGSLELDVSANGERRTLAFPMTHVWSGPHKNSLRTGPTPPPPPAAAPDLPMATPEPDGGR
jgi:hypothetical protein